MAEAAPLLTIERLAADYGQRRVIAGLSLTLSAGQTLVVAGANGSGKSTLLRIMAGLQRPSGGTVTYQIGAERIAPSAARAIVGYIAPDLMLYRELTARENLQFFAEVRGLHRSRTELDALLAEVGLPGRGDDLLAAYSSGMTQRLRYACALIHAPPVLLLDEPTVTLDTRGATVVDWLVTRQRQRGICVIATNDPRELRYGDIVVRLGE